MPDNITRTVDIIVSFYRRGNFVPEKFSKQTEVMTDKVRRMTSVTGALTPKAKKLGYTINTLRDQFAGMGDEWTKYATMAGLLNSYVVENTRSLSGFEQVAKKTNMTAGQVQSALAEFGMTVDRNGYILDAAGKKIKRQDLAVKALMGSTRRFRFEWLSLMFGFMAINRSLSRLAGVGLQAAGIFDILGAAMKLLMLPAALDLIPASISILKTISQWSPTTQKAIGWTVMLGAALTGLAMILSMFKLAWAGQLSVFWRWMMSLLAGGNALSSISKLLTGFGVVAGIVTLIIIGMIQSWKDNFMGFREWFGYWWGGLQKMFGGLFDILSGAFGAIFALLTGDFSGFLENIKKMFTGIGEFLAGFVETTLGAIGMIFIGAFRILFNVYKFFYDMANWVFGKIEKVTGKLPGRGAFGGLPTGAYQEGGIVTRPTIALLGEAGPEAVIPLTRGTSGFSPTINIYANVASSIDMDTLAKRISERLYLEMRRVGVR